ncbi:MAG: hypothetical protein DI620_05260 [Haemophilus parainfluenzae]|nr:MAG: hypothetical protein DI620_05260 [Haemophilus parainfluenzae]
MSFTSYFRYPEARLRRLRQHPFSRALVQENHLLKEDLIYPMFVQEGHKMDDKAKKNVVNGGAIRGNPKHKFAGKFNPSYVLCKGTQGDVYAKYVGPRYGYAYRWYSIWVP